MSKAFDFAKCIEGSGSYSGQMIPASNNATGTQGELRYNTSSNQLEYSTGSAWWAVKDGPIVPIQYLVVGGGGSGGGQNGGGYHSDGAGGGGGGGFRTNFGSGNINGGLTAVEAAMTLDINTAYTVTVGAGGVAVANNKVNGDDSVFHTITSLGGGGGGTGGFSYASPGMTGGSGGGGAGRSNASGGGGTSGQGFAGGNAGANQSGGGGGGAGQAGGSGEAGTGGNGIESSITGTATFYAGGGGAGTHYNLAAGVVLAGGNGGGGAGAAKDTGTPVAGTANTGGGGGGIGRRPTAATIAGANGGSGVVILRVPNTITATFSAGVTASQTSTPGNDKVYTVTAGTGTVTFS